MNVEGGQGMNAWANARIPSHLQGLEFTVYGLDVPRTSYSERITQVLEIAETGPVLLVHAAPEADYKNLSRWKEIVRHQNICVVRATLSASELEQVIVQLLNPPD